MANPAANNGAGYRVVSPQREETLASSRRAADLLGEAYRTYLDTLPANIRAVRALWLSKLFDCAADGIPIWHVPRTEVIDSLMEADSFEERYAVLDQYRDEIIVDCRVQIELLDPNERPFLSEIAAALESGLWRAAQALAMNVVELKLPDRLSVEAKLIRKSESAADIMEEDPKQVFVCIALHSAFRKFYPDSGGPIPKSPNRHATVHMGYSHQYTPTNALIGLMLATCAARFEAIADPEG